MKSPPRTAQPPVRLLSVVIPAHNEEGCIAATVEHLFIELRLHGIEHEIIVVDDGSTDRTWSLLAALGDRVPTLRPAKIRAKTVLGALLPLGSITSPVTR